MHAESELTPAPKVCEMTISLESAILWGVIAVIVFAAINREWVRQRVKKENKDRELLAALQSVHVAMQTVASRTQDKTDMARDNHQAMLNEVHQIGVLVLDVERRLTRQVEETRDVLRDRHRASGTRIDISGNVNQAGGQISNE